MSERPIISHLRPELPPTTAADIDSDRLKRFWDWEWADENGGTWRIVNTDNKIDANAFIYSSGDILYKPAGAKEFNIVGDWVRFLNIESGYARHNRFEITAQDLQQQGFGRAWLEHTARQYRDWRIKDIYLETDFYGSTTWPKFGFQLDGPDNEIGARQQLDDIVHDVVAAIDATTDTGANVIAYRDYLENLLKQDQYSYGDIIGYNKDLAREYMHDLKVDFKATPDEVLGAIQRRYHRPEIDGQTSLTI